MLHYPSIACSGITRLGLFCMGWADEGGNELPVPISQGKAVRPTLCLFACEAVCDSWSPALPAAAALELIHNFSLIHDDIQDGDIERRHRPTVWALWGQAQALVAGNAMRSLADLTALRLTDRGVRPERALGASLLLTDGYLEMTRGQCMDLAFEGSDEIGLDDYLTMISCKTGALIRCGMEMGALIATGVTGVTDSMSSFANCGRYLGLAFQIRDDMLGIWGDETSTGKAVGNDIRRKKKSFPIVYALSVAGEAARKKLVEIYSNVSLVDDDIQEALSLFEELNVANHAQKMVSDEAELALSEARRLELPSWARQEIEALVEFLTTRQY